MDSQGRLIHLASYEGSSQDSYWVGPEFPEMLPGIASEALTPLDRRYFAAVGVHMASDEDLQYLAQG